MLDLQSLYFSIGSKKILQDISVQFHPGKFNMILGPNGSGKSSLMKIFSGEKHRYQGQVAYEGIQVKKWKWKDLAIRRAVMSQQPDLHFPLTVEEVVMMGRYPHFSFAPGKRDLQICKEVISQLKLEDFTTRNYLTLSGGEKQRVQFARVLAQVWEYPVSGNRYLFLDEPLNSLDINYQQEFLQTARKMLSDKTILVAVIHDINLAAQYGDKVFFLQEGRLVAEGPPAAILKAPLIEKIFGVKVEVIENPLTKIPVMIYP
ncbi:MAG TPA: heme ABC transporter ATP-binding protein [Chitinophagaceae bacterium]|jgi:iron complex transport system ATP-binding protein|nr:heme ABC transporter ATP-binding protein [Chitinophagaceae bacterium]